jgi:hypothetical protein
MYHGTRAAYLPAIDKQGLIPCGKPGNDASWKYAKRWADETRAQSVYVSPRPEIASLFAERLAAKDRDHGVILTIELPDDMRDHLHIDEAGADPSDDGVMAASDFMRFDGPIKREWIKGYSPAMDLLDRAALRVA